MEKPFLSTGGADGVYMRGRVPVSRERHGVLIIAEQNKSTVSI